MLPDTEVTALSCCNCVFSSSQQTDLHFISAPATKRRKRRKMKRCNCHLQSEDTSCSNPNTYWFNWPDNDPVYHNGTIWKNMVYRNTNTHSYNKLDKMCKNTYTFLKYTHKNPFPPRFFFSSLSPTMCFYISNIRKCTRSKHPRHTKCFQALNHSIVSWSLETPP